MKIHHCLQGSPEWVQLRLGIPTGSQFDRLVTPKGRPSGVNTSEKLMFDLLAERMTGSMADDFQSSWMARGSTLEKDALAFYQLQRNMDTQAVGFVTNDAGTIGVSPDQFVRDDGLMEIKCPKPGVHVSYLLGSGSPYDDYKVQVQGQLWITGRQWCDVVSYNPVMPMALVRIPRDNDFISDMVPLIEAFSEKLEAKAFELAEKGWIVTERRPEFTFSAGTVAAFAEWSANR